MNLKKQLITTLVVWTIACVNVIRPMENPSHGTDVASLFENLEKQDILIKDYNGGRIKFSKMMIGDQPVFCITNIDGTPEMFSTAIKMGHRPFACMTICTPQAKMLMDRFTAAKPLFEQDNVTAHFPGFYKQLEEYDFFKCHQGQHERLSLLCNTDGIIYDSGTNLADRSISERWNIFYKMLQFLVAVKDNNCKAAADLLLDPSVVLFKDVKSMKMICKRL